jgi:hypothetical protein
MIDRFKCLASKNGSVGGERCQAEPSHDSWLGPRCEPHARELKEALRRSDSLVNVLSGWHRGRTEEEIDKVVIPRFAEPGPIARSSEPNVATQDPFLSDPRSYDPATSATTKKLWVAAIDLNAMPGTDPSHPAFYLPGQELLACRLCGRIGPHRSGPDDRFHHVVLNPDGSYPD